MYPLQNPLLWTRRHKVAWIVVSAVGAVAGLLFGFIHSPEFYWPRAWHGFMTWSSFPQLYWRWPVFGVLGTALAFYAVQLFRRSN